MSTRQSSARHSRISALLDDAVDPVAMRRLWRGANERRMRAERRVLVFRTALVSVAAALFVAAVSYYFTAPGGGDSVGAEASGRLRLSDGAMPGSRLAGTVAFADGSEIRAVGRAHWIPLRNDRKVFEGEMTTGTVAFDVTPGGPRRWIVHAGATTISVLGTRFTIDYAESRTRVRVDRGVVRVRDRRLPNGVRTLGAAEFVVVRREEESTPSDNVSGKRPSTSGMGQPPGNRAISASTRVPPDPVTATLSAEAIESEGWRDGAEVHRLMERADVARLAGNHRSAARILTQLSESYPDHPEASVAAIVLGRIEMDHLDRPDRARRAFDLATRLGVPAPLRADVEARLRALR